MLVIGSGVGGLQAVIITRKRGCKVTLPEKIEEFGGTIDFTDYDEDKEDLRNFENLLTHEAGESGAGEARADVRLSMMCSREIMDECKPDTAIIVTGAQPAKSSIKGIDRAMNALEAYRNMDKIGKYVASADGELVGCEVGLHLASHGHEVAVIEMRGMMAFGTSGYYRSTLLGEVDRHGLKQMPHTKVLGFTDKGALVETDGEQELIAANTCVYSMGMKADRAVMEEIREMTGRIRICVTGDCDRVGKVGDAAHAGCEAAADIA